MAAERVGRAHDGVLWDQVDGSGRDAVVLRDLRPVLLERVSARERVPDGERAEPVVREEGEDNDASAQVRLPAGPALGEARGSEDAGDDERGDQPGGVV